jgi:hypothetical protein
MKIIVLCVLATSISLSGYSQKESSDILPPLKMLPKAGEVKHIYELPSSFDYIIFDSNGKALLSGNGQFIDYTCYEKGTYFVRFDGKSESFEKK